MFLLHREALSSLTECAALGGHKGHREEGDTLLGSQISGVNSGCHSQITLVTIGGKIQIAVLNSCLDPSGLVHTLAFGYSFNNQCAPA